MDVHTKTKRSVSDIATDSFTILGQLEDWVEQLMDEGEWLQARILIDKVFEARFLVQRALDAQDIDETNYLLGIIQRVKRQYDPAGSLVRQVAECKSMLKFMDTQIITCMKDLKQIDMLRNKLDEANFLVNQSLTKRDETQVIYLFGIISRLFAYYQTMFSPYKSHPEKVFSDPEKQTRRSLDQPRNDKEKISLPMNDLKKTSFLSIEIL